MRYAFKPQPEARLVRVETEGRASRAAFTAMTARLALKIRKHGFDRVLFDHRRLSADIAGVSSEDIRDYANMHRRYADLLPIVRAASVCDSPVLYGIARMFEAYSSLAGLKIDHRAFMSEHEAIRWLQDSTRRETLSEDA